MTVTPDLRLLRYFVAVAEELNFTRAAARLHVAQQSLSSQIRQLERELGVELLRRTTRKVELTPAGGVFLEDARKVLRESEGAVERVRRAGRGELGTLRVGYTMTASYEALPKISDALLSRCPDLKVETREFYASELLPAVAQGRYDVGLTREPEPFQALEARQIAREPFVAAVGERHPLASRPEVLLAELARETLVLWPRGLAPGYYDAVVGAFERAGLSPKVHTGPAGSSVWDEIARKGKVGVVVASLECQKPYGVALLPLAPPVPDLGLSVVWKHGGVSPVVRQYLKAAHEVVAAEGWLA